MCHSEKIASSAFHLSKIVRMAKAIKSIPAHWRESGLNHNSIRRGTWIVLLLTALCAAPATAKDILTPLEYGPATLTLQGFVAEKRFYGPPEYGAEPKADRRINAYLLLLPKPVDFQEGGQSTATEPTSGARQITLVGANRTTTKQIRQYLGREIEVAGRLYHGSTGGYWTYLVLKIDKVRLLPRTTGRDDW